MSESAIHCEEHIDKLLNNLELDIPKYKDTIEIEGKKAIIYERVDGKVLGEHARICKIKGY